MRQWVSTCYHWYQQKLDRYLAASHINVVLWLTALLILLHGLDHFAIERLPEKIIALMLLTSVRRLRQPLMWWVLTACVGVTTIKLWYLLVNHEYLLLYWCAVCAIAVQSKQPLGLLRWHGRLLIGLCFLFATVWKVIGGEYLDGGFLHLTFLLDQRLSMGAVVLGGVHPHDLATNQEIFSTFQTQYLTSEIALLSTSTLAIVSVMLSFWTILIEGLVAAAFLIPAIPWLYRYRDYYLLVFIITTYTVVPVLGFAALLFILGLSQCEPFYPQRRRIYLGLLGLLPFWMYLPQFIFTILYRLLTIIPYF